VVIQNISVSLSELFPNYVPRPPLHQKVGGHDPPQLLWERRPCTITLSISSTIAECTTSRAYRHFVSFFFRINGGQLDAKGNCSPTSNNTKYEVGTLAVDGCAITFGTARLGLGGLRPRLDPSSLYQM